MPATAQPTFPEALSPSDQTLDQSKRALLAEVDASCRVPVLFFFSSALVWLIIGTLFALLTSYKLNAPGLLNQAAWLTFGRIRPAHMNAVVYGFGSQMAIGVTLWLMCRLCRVPLLHQGIILLAGVFWNIGVTIGIAGILAGDSTGIEWLEMPGYASPVIFAAYALIGLWGIITFRYRRERQLYVSQWYLLAALLWFPWIYSTANIMLVAEPVRGTVQAAVNWWYAHNVLGLWFTPVGLAAIYYFIPKVIGRPIHSYHLSILGFWSLALFYNWNGMHHLVGGPMPAWLISVSIVASVMMLIPVTTVGINHHLTMWGHFQKLRYSPTLRFIVFGGMSYTLASLQGVLSALRSVSEVTHFTHHTIAHSHLGMYAFFTMSMFGAIYYIAPRLTGREWPSAALISLHFWAAAIGIILYVVPLTIGGFLQGRAMNNPEIPFLQTVVLTKKYLLTRSVAGSLMALGHLALVVNFAWLLARCFGPYRQPAPMILQSTKPAVVQP